MKTISIAAALLLMMTAGVSANTWIGQVTDQHCTPEHKAIEGDDARCIVFIANDHQVYTIDNQDAVKPHVGHEVQITGTLNEEMVIGISYETQGIVHANTVKMLKPLELSDADKTQFQAWMKGMQGLVTGVRTVIVSKDKTPLKENADKLAAQFDNVSKFLAAHQSKDAAEFADSARDAAKSIGGLDVQVEQILALRKVQEACSNCHVAHRAGKQGDYKIQP
jgi:hypothetical protein